MTAMTILLLCYLLREAKRERAAWVEDPARPWNVCSALQQEQRRWLMDEYQRRRAG